MEASPAVVRATRRVGGSFGSHPDSPQRCALCRSHGHAVTLDSVGAKADHLRKSHGAMVWREDQLMHYLADVPA